MKIRPQVQRLIDRMDKSSDAEIRGEMERCGPGQDATIAGQIILDRRAGVRRSTEEDQAKERHQEALQVATSANQIAKWAIFFAVLALIVSVVQTFW
jgi:hypothetical protein